MPWCRSSQSVVHGPAASPSPGHFLEMQILWPHPRPTESEILGWGPEICVLTSPAGDCDAQSRLRTTALVQACLSKMAENLTSVDILWKGNSTSWLQYASWPHQDSGPAGWHGSLLLQCFHVQRDQGKWHYLAAFSATLRCQHGGLFSAHSRNPWQSAWVWQWALRRPSAFWAPRKNDFLFVFKEPRCTELD